MFILYKPNYSGGANKPLSWSEVDRDTDYGTLLRRNLVAGQTVGAVSFGTKLVYLVFLDETLMKVVFVEE